ncbi:hypothetical protein V1L54_11375 [Streptomyces sp. TRM 70361]|uniref:hypothetical protein n=1 Tax=Streptomyces sp. TRM 70361 TaxID=3116553 RepID=UPI002E7B4DFD|nr:hypothetical protein [Streptomyces sp. TRM 70361]MEE1939993.1 hypothetical protein [Streptomyces sp. TRM 70361]
MSAMRLRTASLLLRVSRAQRMSPRVRRALAAVLGAADSGDPAGLRVLAEVVASRGPEAVWPVWLELWEAATPARRWASPVLAELTADASAVPGRAVDAAWLDWLQWPDAGLWFLLERWDRPAAGDPRTHALSRLALGDDRVPLEPRLLADTAARRDHPIGEHARNRLLASSDPEAVDLYCARALDSPEVREFCVAHGLAPSGEVERAVFFVRTGQQEQYEALDPDGALLALGYRGASTAERVELRAAMAALDGIDTLRVLAGQRSDRREFAFLTAAERNWLVRQLTDRGDWDRLWPLVPLMPLPQAVDTVGRFGAWRPAAGEDRELFEALRTADPLIVNDGLISVSVMPSRIEPVRVGLGPGGGFAVHAMDFSPDGRHLAFAGSRDTYQGCAGALDLRDRRLVRFHSDFTHRLSHVAHLGSDAFVVAEEYVHTSRPEPARKLYHVDRRGARPLAFETVRVCGLARASGEQAFLVVAQRQISDARPRFEIFLCAGDGPPTQVTELRGENRFHPWGAAVSPDRRLAAVFGERDVMVADLAGGAVNTLDSGPADGAVGQAHAALSASALVRVTLDASLKVWHDPLTSGSPPTTAGVWSAGRFPTGLAWSPALHQFLTVGDGHLEILAVPPIRDIPPPDQLVHDRIELVGAPRRRPRVRLSPKGDVLAVTDGGATVLLYDLTPRETALTRPMGSLNGQDLAEVDRLRRSPRIRQTARQALTLLLACLEYRFRHDIGITDAVSTGPGTGYEIALGGDGKE